MGFKKDFIWGSATSAYQVEGAFDEDGKGVNIWDVTSHLPGVVKHNENGDVAIDHYHRMKEDVQLLKEMGLKAYRFSISWARVLPEGTGKVNEKGLQFYKDLVDELIKAGIRPFVTLYHWDLPYALHLKGGFGNPDFPQWFAEYTKVMVDALSDKVTDWMTFNEPQCIIGLGYFMGAHAPFYKCDQKTLFLMTHNLLKAHGMAVKTIRQYAKTKARVGFGPTGPVFVPKDESREAVEEARRRSFAIKEMGYFATTLYSDPIIFGKYPEDAKEMWGDAFVEPSKEDMELISQPIDFYAMNVYYAAGGPMNQPYRENEYQGAPKSAMDWVTDEKSLYWSAKFHWDRYKLPIIITENGYAGLDVISLDGKCHDPQRIDYTHRYLRGLKAAAEEGVDVDAYFYWSAFDNFEWAWGYDKRFGLVYVDYQTQERTMKDSAYWYKDVIEANGENL